MEPRSPVPWPVSVPGRRVQGASGPSLGRQPSVPQPSAASAWFAVTQQRGGCGEAGAWREPRVPVAGLRDVVLGCCPCAGAEQALPAVGGSCVTYAASAIPRAGHARPAASALN